MQVQEDEKGKDKEKLGGKNTLLRNPQGQDMFSTERYKPLFRFTMPGYRVGP